MGRLAFLHALVTGASSGIGVDFARLLASEGADLVLVARREERLRALAAELAAAHGVKTTVVAADLSRPDGPARVFEATQALERPVDILINNAGFGYHGPCAEGERERQLGIIDVNARALVDLSLRYLPLMLAQGRGYILNVASTAAYGPIPFFCTYAATKALVHRFSVGLHHELRRRGIVVTVLNPGPTETEFLAATGKQATRLARLMWMPSERVARAGLEGLAAGRAVVVPGLRNKLSALLSSAFPERWTAPIAGRLMGLVEAPQQRHRA